MKHFLRGFLPVALIFAVAILASFAGENLHHYREACLECAARCDGYRPVVTTYRTPQGVRGCYCDTTKPDPDVLLITANQQLLDSITSEPPTDFHL